MYKRWLYAEYAEMRWEKRKAVVSDGENTERNGIFEDYGRLNLTWRSAFQGGLKSQDVIARGE